MTQSRRRRHFQPFLNFDKCRPEVAGDVISGTAVDFASLEVLVKFGDSDCRRGEVIDLTECYELYWEGVSKSG